MSTNHRVRVLGPDELRSASDLFGTAMHLGLYDDESWAGAAATYPPGRILGVDDPEGAGLLAGTALSHAWELTVPGGARLPMAAVTRVGVRADRTRRGILTALMHEQLRAAAGQGEVVATLRASQAPIYGRFGYGLATRGRNLRVRAGAALLPGVPAGGRIRLLTRAEAEAVLPALQARIHDTSCRPGAVTRDAGWWWTALHRQTRGSMPGVAVHTGPDGDDGYAAWTVRPEGHEFGENLLEVADLHTASPAAHAALWRFLLGMDLLVAVSARLRPLDEPVDLYLADPRDCATTGIADETWLRLLDVRAALAARSWGAAEPVRIRVHDPLLPDNDGVHVAGDPGATTAGEAELECDVAGLAMAYLGDRCPSELVAAGRWTAHDPAAVARADALFAIGAPPWSGTFF